MWTSSNPARPVSRRPRMSSGAPCTRREYAVADAYRFRGRERPNRAPPQPRADAPHIRIGATARRESVSNAHRRRRLHRQSKDYDEPQRRTGTAARARIRPRVGSDSPTSAAGTGHGPPRSVQLPPPRRAYVEEDAGYERAARRSRLPGILLFLLVIAVVGGLGALGWSQRAMLTNLLATFDSGGCGCGPEGCDAGGRDPRPWRPKRRARTPTGFSQASRRPLPTSASSSMPLAARPAEPVRRWMPIPAGARGRASAATGRRAKGDPLRGAGEAPDPSPR